MEFRCEDLAAHGLRLVPPSAAEFDALLQDIRGRMETAKPSHPPMPNPFRSPIPEQDRETAAILLNSSGQGIWSMRFVWRFEDGTQNPSVRSGTIRARAPNMLLEGWAAKLTAIMPGSKRYLAGGYAYGDNRDAFPALKHWALPAFSDIEEHGSPSHPQRVTLSLDGAFFPDGTFVGPNRYHLWEQVVFAAEEQQGVSQLVRELRKVGEPTDAILEKVAAVTGPAPGVHDRPMRVVPGRDHPEAYRVAARRQIATQVAWVRATLGDELAVQTLAAWPDKPRPHFRRLS